MIRGAIFDLDGTILDSMKLWDTLGADYLRSLGIEPKEDLSKTFRTMSLTQAADYYRTVYHVPKTKEDIIRGVIRRIETFYRYEAEPKPQIEVFLQKLKEKNVRICLATASDQTLAEAALKRGKIRDFFSGIFTCESVGHGKDEPEIYRRSADFLGTGKAQTAVFEDAFHAAKTAKEDGFFTVAVFDRSEAQQEQLRAISDYAITDFSDFDTFWKIASEKT